MSKYFRYLAAIFLALSAGCGNPNQARLTGVCDEDYGIDNTWIYIYKLEQNDYHITDSCLIQDNRFELCLDVPYEYRYVLFMPGAAHVKMLDIVLRPGDRFDLHLPNRGTKRNDITFINLDESPPTKAFFYIQRQQDETAALFRAIRDSSINYPKNSATWKYWNDSLEKIKYYWDITLTKELFDDPGIENSPSAFHRLLVNASLEFQPQMFDDVFLDAKQRFPNYPPIRDYLTVLPMSREGWRDWARVRTLLGLETPPYEEPVVDTIPVPKNVKVLKVGDCIADITMNTTIGVAKTLKTINTDYILLDFWASWCQPCMKEADEVLRDLQEQYKDRLTICAVSIDTDDEKWRAAIEKIGTQKFRHYRLVQPHADFKRTQIQFGISAIPRTILLDKDRRIIAIDLRGEALEQKMKKLIEK